MATDIAFEAKSVFTEPSYQRPYQLKTLSGSPHSTWVLCVSCHHPTNRLCLIHNNSLSSPPCQSWYTDSTASSASLYYSLSKKENTSVLRWLGLSESGVKWAISGYGWSNSFILPAGRKAGREVPAESALIFQLHEMENLSCSATTHSN